jgi:hypothetical protein
MDDRQSTRVYVQKGHQDPQRVCADSGTMRPFSREVMRAGSEDALIERRDFRIRVADTQGHRSNVSLLIERMYSWRGYQTNTAKVLKQTPNHITLVASRNEHSFGTLTVGLDSASGLVGDELYRPELDAIRAEGRTVCEFGKLAVDPEYGTKDVLAALFHLAFMYAYRINHCDDIVIEVNPRHVVFYKRMLGFVQAGPERTCERVSAAAILLRLPCAYAAAQITRYGGTYAAEQLDGQAAAGNRGTRSLYPFFFSVNEEEGLCARLQRLSGETVLRGRSSALK